MKRIYLSSPKMGRNEQNYVKSAFDTNWLAPVGPNIDAFEKSVCDLTGAKHSVALSSGTAAIHMALKCVGVDVGDRVFCSTFTFAASCNPIMYEHAVPVFVDSEPETWNMSPIALEKAFVAHEDDLPKAVIVVHLYGQCAKMDEIMEICNRWKVPVIEDAAEALGATYNGQHAGTFGKYGIYSFNGNKIITATSGGMLVSDCKESIEKVKFLSTQARDNAPWYQHSEIGYNYRMSNVLAGIGLGQMEVLHERISEKKDIYAIYENMLRHTECIDFMPHDNASDGNFWLTCVTINDESAMNPMRIIERLAKHNIEARPLWKPMHLQPCYSYCSFYSHLNHETESISEDLFKRGICLPSDVNMSVREQFRVFQIIQHEIDKYEGEKI